MLTKEQLEMRQHRIGGSDAPAILGMNRDHSPADVWLDKIHPETRSPIGRHADWGNRQEPIVAEYYAETEHCVLKKGETQIHPEHDWIAATPDFIRHDKIGLEVKTADHWVSEQWGQEGTDQIPQAYIIQVQHYLWFFGFERWDVAVLIGGNDYRRYSIFADKELQDMIIDAEREFYFKYIKGGKTPPLKTMSEVQNYMKRKYAFSSKDKTIEITPYDSDIKLLKLLQEKIAAKKSAVEDFENAKLTIQAMMKDTETILCPSLDMRCVWKNVSDKNVPDWQAIAETALEATKLTPEEKANLIQKHTHLDKGERKFNTWAMPKEKKVKGKKQ